MLVQKVVWGYKKGNYHEKKATNSRREKSSLGSDEIVFISE